MAHPEFERELVGEDRLPHVPRISMEEADRRMESAGEIPFSSHEIEAMVRRATTDPLPPSKVRVTYRRTFCKRVAALLLAAAILFGCLLMMSVSSVEIGFPAPRRPSASSIEAERAAVWAALLAWLEVPARSEDVRRVLPR